MPSELPLATHRGVDDCPSYMPFSSFFFEYAVLWVLPMFPLKKLSHTHTSACAACQLDIHSVIVIVQTESPKVDSSSPNPEGEAAVALILWVILSPLAMVFAVLMLLPRRPSSVVGFVVLPSALASYYLFAYWSRSLRFRDRHQLLSGEIC